MHIFVLFKELKKTQSSYVHSTTFIQQPSSYVHATTQTPLLVKLFHPSLKCPSFLPVPFLCLLSHLSITVSFAKQSHIHSWQFFLHSLQSAFYVPYFVSLQQYIPSPFVCAKKFMIVICITVSEYKIYLIYLETYLADLYSALTFHRLFKSHTYYFMNSALSIASI